MKRAAVVMIKPATGHAIAHGKIADVEIVTGATEEMIAAGVTAMTVAEVIERSVVEAAEAIVMKAHARKTAAEVARVGKTKTWMTNVRKTATRVLLLRRKIAMTV